MGLRDNFGYPRGVIGKIMLSGMNKGHSHMINWVPTQVDIPNEGNMLDIGCGGGSNIKNLLEISANGNVYGLDISETSVSKSKSVNKKYLGTRCEVYQGNADNLPFEDDFMDLVTALETVFFWNDLHKCFLEVKRILKKGGKFVIINDPGDPEKHWEDMIPNMTPWSAEELEDFMKKAGFIDIKINRKKFMFSVTGTKGDE